MLAITTTPIVLVAPAPIAAVTEFAQIFDANASPSIRAWADAEAAALATAPLDLKRLERDATARAGSGPNADTVALILRLAVEARLERIFEARHATVAATGGSSQSQLMQATQGMQEQQMSFNMQYLQLQNSMQNDNRQFTLVSNILQTKHDTVKNTISNIH